MSKEVDITNKDQKLMAAIEQAVTTGNIDGLNPEQRMFYYNHVCESVGLNPFTRPLDFIRLNGRTVLYARKDATDQLRKIYGVSIVKIEQETQGDCCIVTAYAKDKNGKEDSDVGAVPVGSLKGEAYANAIMKCVTKAKRRVTLSICGMGLLDESEFDTVPEAAAQLVQQKTEAKTNDLKERLSIPAPKTAEEPAPEPVAVTSKAKTPEVVGKPKVARKGKWEAREDDKTLEEMEDPAEFFEKPGPEAVVVNEKPAPLPKRPHEAAIEKLRRAKTLDEAAAVWNETQAAIKSKEINLEKLDPTEAHEFIQNFKTARNEKKAELTKHANL